MFGTLFRQSEDIVSRNKGSNFELDLLAVYEVGFAAEGGFGFLNVIDVGWWLGRAIVVEIVGVVDVLFLASKFLLVRAGCGRRGGVFAWLGLDRTVGKVSVGW